MSIGYDIEDGIPIPEAKGYRTDGGAAGALRQMEVGQSVFFAGKRTGALSGQIADCKPKRFTTRVMDGGLRVWRIE